MTSANLAMPFIQIFAQTHLDTSVKVFFFMRLILKTEDFEGDISPSIMWADLIHSVESLKKKTNLP